MIWNIIQKKTNSFFIFHCMYSGRKASALKLSQKIRCGVFNSNKHIGMKVNKAEYLRLVKQESPQEILIHNTVPR